MALYLSTFYGRFGGNSSVVEHNLAKVGVASSTLVSRFISRHRITMVTQVVNIASAGWQSGYAAACKAVDAGSIPTPASNFAPDKAVSAGA